MSELLIKGGRVIDPSNGINGIFDLLLIDGLVVKVAVDIKSETATVIDATGKWVTPGLIDIHTHLREPGYEYKETIATGSMAAVAGGFTSIACMANTNPVNDNAEVTRLIIETAKREAVANIYVIGAVTKGLNGKQLADIGDMKEAGIVALSDDGKCVGALSVMRSAMEYAGMFGLPIIEHAEDPGLSLGTVMNEGFTSLKLGLPGNPTASEEVIVSRDAVLAGYLDVHIHIAHVSSKGAVRAIREAKERGVRITAEAAPHHFSITDETCDNFNTMAKVAPPLRTDEDVAAIREGLADGTIDCIATDHAPHAVNEKELEFELAAFGISGLETAVPLSLALAREGVMSEEKLIETMTCAPAGIIGIDRGTLSEGAVADVTIIDPNSEWTVDPENFASKGRNTPFAGWRVKGRAVMTIVKGKIVYEC